MRALWVALLVACGGEKGEEPNDTGAPADVDTDADSDTDSDVDTDTDADTDVVETIDTAAPEPCGLIDDYENTATPSLGVMSITQALGPAGGCFFDTTWRIPGCTVTEVGMIQEDPAGGWTIFYDGITSCSDPDCATPWDVPCQVGRHSGIGHADLTMTSDTLTTIGLFEDRGTWPTDHVLTWRTP